MPDTDDTCLGEMYSDIELPFRSGRFRKIFVCPNGIMCFDKRYESYTVPSNGEYRDDFKDTFCLAPYFADLHVTNAGSVYYQAYDLLTEDEDSQTADVASTVARLVNETYMVDFTPAFVAKATWDQVEAYDGVPDENVTFQVIFTSDGQKSFAFYTYLENGMKLSQSTSRTQFIGSIVDGFAEGPADSPDGSFLREPDQNLVQFGSECRGGLSYHVTEDDEAAEANYRAICKSWHKEESKNRDQYRRALRNMPICPCSTGFLWWDRQFSLGWSTFDDDEILSVPVVPSFFYYPHGKTCNYNIRSGGFIRSGQNAGSFSSYNIMVDERNHELEDNYYKAVCCDRANRCDLYRDVRPTVNICYNAFPFSFAWFWGDPHITTLDGRTYTFNGHGEYILVKLDSDQDSSVPPFQIQCRTERAKTANGTDSEATIFSGFAVEGNGTWLQIELNTEKNGVDILAGTNNTDFADYTTDYNSQGSTFSLQSISGLDLSRVDNTTVAVFTDIGITFNVTVGVGLLQMSLGMHTKYQEKTIGLLGNFDGISDDDFLPRGATEALAANITERQIYSDFGQTWMTTPEESVFRYSEGILHDDFQFKNFTPTFYDEAPESLKREAEEICHNNTQCMYDYVVTGNKELAQVTTATDEQAIESTAEAENKSPSLNVTDGIVQGTDGDNLLYVNRSQEASFRLEAGDENLASIQFDFVQNSAHAAFSNAPVDGIQDVSLTLDDATPVNVSIVVKDTRNVSSAEVDIVIVYCSLCSEHGTCDFDNLREDSTENFKYASCVCDDGWTGLDCETDFDACIVVPCSVGRNCTDNSPAEVAAGMKPYTCTPCPIGFRDIDDKCFDINECNGTSPCDVNAECVNTEGSYTCVCNSGYRAQLSNDETLCIDINECEESTSGCDQICTNEPPGTFSCSCMDGFTLNNVTDKCEQDFVPRSCNDSSINCTKADGCLLVNETGLPACFCKSGYQLVNNDTCEDINECDTGACAQSCDNTDGSFSCSCYAGYTLEADKISCTACQFPRYGVECSKTCLCGSGADRCDPVHGCVCKAGYKGSRCETDIDECTLDPNLCNEGNKKCVNTVGSYTCNCMSGYTFDANKTCTDVDECESAALNTCQQTCTNTQGGFSCSCNSGYNIDPDDALKCVDYDECLAGASDCEHICTNSVGRYSCACYFGYRLNSDRKTCTEVQDICQLAEEQNLHCSQICRKDTVINRIYCSCRSGFKLGTDNATCIDIKECEIPELNECGEPDSCVESDGGYMCSCSAGFKLENDLRTCTACDAFHYGVNCSSECDCGVGASRCDSVDGCVCLSGWTGAKCDSDKDECASNTTNDCTGDNEQCVNTPGNFNCECLNGFGRKNGNCVDIKECSSTTLHDCSQICTNSIGSYTCSCNAGFQQDGTACNDIDECAVQHDCGHICTNTLGSYRCLCNAGFKLDIADRRSCIPETQCATPSPCTGEADCTSVNGVDTCSCRAGYDFAVNSTTSCVDIPECSADPCSQTCLEIPGSFECACNEPGYVLDTDKLTCIVCPQGQYGNNCTQNCTCSEVNSESCDAVTGSCTCKLGWTGNDCSEDIKECNDTAVHNCPVNSQCVEEIGSFTCKCDVGYSKTADGQCEVCTNSKYGDNCEQDCACVITKTDTCDNVNGSCTCKPGWEGAICNNDTNECLDSNICGDVLKTCNNTEGSHVCSCNQGYSNVEGTCKDIDECLEGTDTCTYDCTNEIGTYYCVCHPGFSGDGVMCTECSGNTFGDNCTQDCNCSTANTLSPSQSCNHVTGVCECKPTWQGDTCDVDVNECEANTHECPNNSSCENTNGSYVCNCDIGFEKDNNDLCIVCAAGTWGTACGEDCLCVDANTNGTCNHINGKCTCNTGWTNDTCSEDINECLAQIHGCPDNSTCQNTNGSRVCNCDSGFEKDNNDLCIVCTAGAWGQNCEELCLCVDANTNGTCNPVNGECTCNPGWTGDTCSEDIDECSSNTDDCAPNTTCHNTMGSFICCDTGFTKDNNDACIECSGNTFGDNCTQDCNCSTANTLSPSQSCNHVTGVCECKPTWQGDTCDVDVNECDNSTICSDPTRGCHNLEGTYECSCLIGYIDNNGVCEQTIITTPTVPVQDNEVAISMYVTFNYAIPANVNINATSTYQAYTEEVQTKLLAYYKGIMGEENVIAIIVIRLKAGSLIAEYEIVTPSTSDATTKLTEATVKLPVANIVLFGENAPVTELSVGGNPVDVDNINADAITCHVFIEANGQCESNKECAVIDDVPECKLKSTEDNFALYVGLGVGIPLFLITVLIIVVMICMGVRKHRQKHKLTDFDRDSFNHGFFPRTMPVKIDTWGRRDPVFNPATLDRSSSDSFEDNDVHRQPRDFDNVPYDNFAFGQDNRGASNFSWDFLYNYIGPSEKIEIPRPHHETRPQSLYLDHQNQST